MGRYKIKRSKDWKAKLRPYCYLDLFERAVERTVELGLPAVDVEYVDARHFSPRRLKELGSFVAEEFATANALRLIPNSTILRPNRHRHLEVFERA